MIVQVCQADTVHFPKAGSPQHQEQLSHFVPAPYLHFAAVLKPDQLLRCGDRANQTKLINQNSDLNFETIAMNPFFNAPIILMSGVDCGLAKKNPPSPPTVSGQSNPISSVFLYLSFHQSMAESTHSFRVSIRVPFF